MTAVINIKDCFYLRFWVEEQPLPEMPAMFNSIAVVEHISQAVPTTKLSMYDPLGLFSKELAFVEGTKVSLEFGQGLEHGFHIGEYRVFGSNVKENAADGSLWELVLVMSLPKYAIKSCTEVYANGNQPITSCQAMAQLAKLSGLKYDPSGLQTTQDLQRWINVAQTRASMADYIAHHGYINDNSCTVHGVTADKVLIYRDIMEELKKPPKAVFLHNRDTGSNTPLNTPMYSVREAKCLSASGLYNTWANYGTKTIRNTLEGTPQILEKLNPNKPENNYKFPINADVRSEIDGFARVEYTTRNDTGRGYADHRANNVHELFDQAYLQNIRYRMLFSERISLLIEERTHLHLLDCVDYQQSDLLPNRSTSYTPNTRTSGKFIVVGKTLYGKEGGDYYERFELARPFVATTGKTTLVG